jgi:uncharacterized membrane protein YeaQ/YmgE (transglycosylase-associated protein family)
MSCWNPARVAPACARFTRRGRRSKGGDDVSSLGLRRRILAGLVGGVIVAGLAAALDRVARGHWLSLSHAFIVGVVAAVIVAVIPWGSLLRRWY